MAGEKKSKIYIYFVGQYVNNLKDNKEFVSQYIMPDFSLGFEPSNVQAFNKSLKERNNQTVLFF